MLTLFLLLVSFLIISVLLLIFLIFKRKQLMFIYLCDCFCVNISLIGRFNALKGVILVDIPL